MMVVDCRDELSILPTGSSVAWTSMSLVDEGLKIRMSARKTPTLPPIDR